MTNLVFIGRILKPHGKKGELKVLPLTYDIKRFEKLDYCILINNPDYDDGPVLPIEYVKILENKNRVIIKFQNINNLKQAEYVREFFLAIPFELRLELKQPDEYYIFDLLNLKVIDGNYGIIGFVTSVYASELADYIEVSTGSREILIPFQKVFIKEVDLHTGIIFTTLPEGMLDV